MRRLELTLSIEHSGQDIDRLVARLLEAAEGVLEVNAVSVSSIEER